MKIDLTGKRAVICGSSKGIGRAIAVEMARAGADIFCAARNNKLLLQLMSELPDGDHDYISVDFQDHKGAVEEIKKKGGFDIIVNNAGGPPPGALIEAETEDFIKAFERHLFFSHELVKSQIPYMKKRNFGRIINVISISVKQPVERLGVSNTLRGAAASWAKTLSQELGAFGITCNNLLPGQTMTERLGDLIKDQSEKSGKSEEEIKQAMINNIPVNRLGKPEDLAYAAVFLASEQASFINGINLPVDGGFLKTL